MNAPLWTEEQDRRLMELWRAGSTRSIYLSGEFNGYSRNAIIGRIFRLRKKWGTEMVPQKQLQPLAPKKKRVRRKLPNFNVKDAVGMVRRPTPIKPPPAPGAARRLPLIELGSKDCRFIVTGDETREHLYCALDASAFADDAGNDCYCAYHRRIMRAGHVR